MEKVQNRLQNLKTASSEGGSKDNSCDLESLHNFGFCYTLFRIKTFA